MSSYNKKKFISKIAHLLTRLQTHKIFWPFYSGVGHILMFHRIVQADNSSLRIHNHQSLEVSPEQLENIISFFKEKNYDFISLSEMYERIEIQKFDRRFVVFTFDDGYIDNYEIAYPIFKKHNIPFVIYITTHFPDRKAILWWYILEDLVRENQEINISICQQNYNFPCSSQEEKEIAFSKVRKLIIKNYNSSFSEFLHELFDPFKLDLFAYTDRLAMSWAQIQVLSDDPLATIGAHTISHPPLIHLPLEDLEREILGSKEILEQRLGQSVEHFAYPFGKITEVSHREFEFMKTLPFLTATTTRVANIFPEHKELSYALPRVSINGVTESSILKLQTSGVIPFFIHKGKKVVSD